MDKSTVREMFGKEVRRARKKIFPNGNQTKFAENINLRLPNNIDFRLGQEIVSKIETGKNLFLTEEFIVSFAQICSDMGYTIDDTLVNDFIKETKSCKKNKHHPNPIINIFEFENIISKPQQAVFSQYFGTYNCFFHSTDSSDPKCVKGTMKISSDSSNNQCKVEFAIIENEKAIKKYEGVFLLNTHYNMWYCILIGNKKQEICMIASQHFNSSIRNNLFNVALVITTSAGMRKRPTMHRMFIARETEELDENKIDLILSQLKLNDDTIFISEKNINAIKNDIEKRMKKSDDENQNLRDFAVLKCIDQICGCSCEKYYRIDEAILYDSSTISKDKKILSYAVSQIRKYTENMYYNKLSDTVHEICTKIMKNL